VIDASQPIRVLIYAASAREGGGQTYLRNLLRRLPDSKVLQLFLIAPRSFASAAWAAGVTVIDGGRAIEHPLSRALWEHSRLSAVLRKTRAQVLFCPGGVVPRLVPRDVKVVTMFRNMLPFAPHEIARFGFSGVGLRLRILRRAFIGSMRRADLLLLLSEYAARTVRAILGKDMPWSLVVPHGVDADFRAGSAHTSHRPVWLPSEAYFLYVSIFDPYKHQIEVMRAYALLARGTSSVPPLVLVGRFDTAYGQRAVKEAERLDMGDRIRFAGPRPHDDLPGAYRHALANIFASSCENCPNILLEMLASGRPALVAHREPMIEFAGDAALMFDPDEPESLAERLAGVLAGPAAAEALGARAVLRAADFDWDRTAARTWDAIRAVATAA
jgi:glycosyltransferase involved in cell wall biosynthesis